MIRYRPLFQVDMAHDYFLSRGAVVLEALPEADRDTLLGAYALSGFLEVFPDQATVATLAGHKMLFRETPTGFLVAVQLDVLAPDIRPLIPPSADFRLRFALRLKDSRFANYTELGADTIGFHRFGNDSQNRVADTNYLSRPVAGFASARRYVAGSIRAQAAGPSFDLFVALRDTGPSTTPVAADWRRIPADTYDPATSYQAGAIVLAANRLLRAIIDDPGTDLTNAAEWQPAGLLGNQYASDADAVRPVPALFALDIRGAALPLATVRVFRGTETAVVSEHAFAAEQGVLGEVQIDLRGFTPGPYRYDVLDATLNVVPGAGGTIYLAPAAKLERWCGVIEIVAAGGEFALLKTDGTLRMPRYALRFLNRATRWRYIFPAAQAVGAGAEVALEAGSDRRMVTAEPLPLTRFGAFARLQADDSTTTVSEEVLLPTPAVDRIRRQNGEWFSEIHLPNLTVGP